MYERSSARAEPSIQQLAADRSMYCSMFYVSCFPTAARHQYVQVHMVCRLRSDAEREVQPPADAPAAAPSRSSSGSSSASVW